MNILAVSPKHNMLFIGCENKIFVFYFKNRWDSRDFDKPKVFQISQNPEVLLYIFFFFLFIKLFLPPVKLIIPLKESYQSNLLKDISK